ncbi:hemicentin-1-like isoform X3, partial [Scomber scombrus]
LQVQVIPSTINPSSVELKCHSSSCVPDGSSFIWYNNGQKISGETSSSYSANVNHTDSYSCAVTGYEDFPSPSVYAPKLPSVSVSPFDEIIEGYSVTLTCSSDANPAAKYTWYKKNVNPDLQPLSKEPQLVFSSIQSSDSGEYYCTADNQLGKRTSEHNILVQAQDDWGVTYTSTQICALKGSTVDINCTYSYPSRISNVNTAVDKTLWFTKGSNNKPVDLRTDSEYADRVQYHCDKKNCSLTITDLRERDSAEYKFRFTTNQPGGKYTASPGVTLTITDAPKLPSVSVSPPAEIIEGSSVTLTCSSDANPAAKYTWYKKNVNPDVQPLSKEPQLVFSSIQYSDSGEYYCTAENQLGMKTSEYIFIDVKYAPKLPSVSVSPSAEIVNGSSVTLMCSSDANPAAKYTWYKKNVNPDLQPLSKEPQLVFSSIQSSDSGEYYCTADNQLGKKTSEYIFIDVKYAPKLPSVSVSPSAEIVEGSSVTLTCISDANPAANYTWYKNNQTLLQRSEGHFQFTSISSEDRGMYSCKSENKYGQINSSFLFIDVQYAPKLPSVSVSPSGEIIEGSSVTLMCSSDANPAAKYTWYKKNVNPDLQPLSKEPQFVFSSIQSSDSGEYYCTAENQLGKKTSEYIFIDVKYAPQLSSVSVSPSGEIIEGSLVNLTCRSDANPAAKYTWYKKNVNPDLQPLSKEPQLVFSSIQSSDSGEYYCTAENRLGKRTSEYIFIDVKYAPKLPSVSVSPSAEIVEGSSVTLTCISDANPAANYTWYKENQTLLQRSERHFHFTSISSEDRGIYYCKSENKYGLINSSFLLIDVQYSPKLPSVSVSPSGEIIEGSSVTLTCSSDANPAANYTWCKKNVNPDLQPLSKEPQFVFSSIQSSDPGEYYCTAENQLGKKTSEYIFIDVKYAPKLPSVSVTPSAEIIEGSSVTLTCNSDANPAAKYTWYKKNVNPDVQPLSKEPQLVFSSIQSSDSGEYYCTAENQLGKRTSEYIFIDVKYAPKLPSVSVSPSVEIVEGSSVTLTCSSDANPAANYTWYKENQTLLQRSERHFHFTSISSEDRRIYYCKSENKYGQINSSFLFIDVQYSPKLPSVSMSPSGEIIEGSSVTLTCSSDANPAANYTWYKKNVNPDLQPLSKEPQFVFSSIQSSDSGEYYCTAENQLGNRTSEYIFIDVKYAPKLPSVSVSPSAEIVEGSSVTLTCISDANPAANYTWYKNNQTLLQRSEGHFHFTSISSEDRGMYSCKSENKYGKINSSFLFIDVQYAPKLPSVSVSPSAEIVEGSSVNLTCSSDANPAANYTWYKENEDSPKASGQIFTITDVRPEHSGNYSCEAHNRRGRHNSTLHLTVVKDTVTTKMNIIRLTLVVLMLIPVLLLGLWMRKTKTLLSTTVPNDVIECMENVSTLEAQTAGTEEQEDML